MKSTLRPINVDLTSWDHATAAAGRHADLEFELVMELMVSPADGAREAKRIGITDDVFHQPDLLIFWRRCCAYRGEGRDQFILATAQDLANADLWDRESRSWERRIVWGPESLMSFAAYYPKVLTPTALSFQRAVIDQVGNRLLRVHRLMVEADKQFAAARDAMQQAASRLSETLHMHERVAEIQRWIKRRTG